MDNIIPLRSHELLVGSKGSFGMLTFSFTFELIELRPAEIGELERCPIMLDVCDDDRILYPYSADATPDHLSADEIKGVSQARSKLPLLD
jgi:hypothetical protein